MSQKNKKIFMGSILLIVSIIAVTGCKTIPIINWRQNQKIISKPEFVDWKKHLENAADTIKNEWVADQPDDNWKFYLERGINISQADIPKLKLIPTYTYRIDYNSALNYINKSSHESPENIIKFEKDKATYYVKKGDKPIAYIQSKLIDNKWVSSTSGP